MPNFTCTDEGGVCIYPQEVRSCCLVCGIRKPFDPADWFAEWPSWAGLKPGDVVSVHGTSATGRPAVHRAIALSAHRGGAQVEVTADDNCEPWIQFIMQGADGVYAR